MLQALDRVLSSTGFPYGSNWYLFKNSQFGRDALEVAEDLLQVRPAIARAVIGRLASLQGTALDPRTEEEPGKIHHEHRALTMDGQTIDEDLRTMFRAMAKQWRVATTEDELAALEEFTLYPTVDATPLYVRLVAEYCKRFGPAILGEEYTPLRWMEGAPRPTLQDSVRQALNWIVSRIERSDVGLLEFRRMSPWGHQFQAWKDGATSYLHPDGCYGNCEAPIASIEVQGLAYDALVAAPLLLADRRAAPAERAAEGERWIELAQNLQRRTLELFWMPGEQYFAMAIDRDPQSGEARQMKLITSNPGALLDSGIFDDLEPSLRQAYVTAIVKRLCSQEFLTPVGIRCSSLVHKDVLDYPAYQSSYTVWHKETYDIAKGLYRRGFRRLAEDLENRMLNAINVTGSPTEFLYVLPDNRVNYDPFGPVQREDAEEIAGTNVPENDQAWSISAALAVKWRRGRRMPSGAAGATCRPDSFRLQSEAEDDILSRIAPARLLRTEREIESAFPLTYSFRINTQKGWERHRAYMERRGI